MENNNRDSIGTIKAIVTIVLVVGIIALMVYLSKGSKKDTLRLGNGKMTDAKTYTYNDVDFASVSSVDMSFAIVDLKYSTGKEWDIRYICNDYSSYPVSVSVENGVLKITGSGHGTNMTNQMKDNGYQLQITVPENVKFNETHISVELGNVILRDLKSDVLTIEADLGNVEIYDFEGKNIEVEADLGNIEVKNAKFEKGNLNASLGNIELSGDFAEIKGSCDLGNLEVKTSRPESEVMLDLSANLGSVKVNGKKYKK